MSPQKTMATKTTPVTIPGTGLRRGDRLPKGARIVYRDVTLEKGQEVRPSVRAPKGKVLRGLGVRADSAGRDHVGFVGVDRTSYVRRRRVRVRAYFDTRADGEQTGRIYGLAR